MMILIDADPIVYRCGFAAEKTSWHLVYETATGEADEIEFHPDEETTAGEHMRTWLAFNEGKVTVLNKSRVVHPDPVSYALRATKVQIESIVAECEAHFKQSGKMLMWISGTGGSYRDKLATIRPYKGNRDPTHKPYHYAAIRDYLRTQYGSYITHGIEADDAVSIFARQTHEIGGESLVVCTIDKDLDQIPGHHYNYMNKVFYAITQTEAERWFVYQILAGDITDNVVGVWKCGEKQTNGILARFTASDFGRTVSRAVGADGWRTGRHAKARASGGYSAMVQCPAGAGGDTLGRSDRQSAESDRALSVPPAIDKTAQSSSVDVESADGSHGSADGAERGSSHDEPDALWDGWSGAEPRVRERRASIAHVPAWWPTVVAAYRDSQRKLACPYADNNPETIAIEMAQLVKLQEYPGQLWHPHGDLVVPGFGEENFDG